MKSVVSVLAMLGLILFAFVCISHWLWTVWLFVSLFLLILAISYIPSKVEQAYMWHLKEKNGSK